MVVLARISSSDGISFCAKYPRSHYTTSTAPDSEERLTHSSPFAPYHSECPYKHKRGVSISGRETNES